MKLLPYNSSSLDNISWTALTTSTKKISFSSITTKSTPIILVGEEELVCGKVETKNNSFEVIEGETRLLPKFKIVENEQSGTLNVTFMCAIQGCSVFLKSEESELKIYHKFENELSISGKIDAINNALSKISYAAIENTIDTFTVRVTDSYGGISERSWTIHVIADTQEIAFSKPSSRSISTQEDSIVALRPAGVTLEVRKPQSQNKNEIFEVKTFKSCQRQVSSLLTLLRDVNGSCSGDAKTSCKYF